MASTLDEERSMSQSPAVPSSPPKAPARLLHPLPYIRAFGDVLRLLHKNRALTVEVVRREIRGQHAGLLLGRAWGILQPLFLMALYAFVFGVVFRVRIGGSFELPRNYTIYSLSGMVPWLAFVQSMARGATAITDNASVVKQTVFQIEVLPVARAITACVPLLVGLLFVAILSLVQYHDVPLTYALVPLLVVLQLIAMTGASFALGAIGAFVRDVREIVQLFSVIGIFVLPIVYLPESVPDVFRPLLYANPFSYVVWAYQDALYYGRFEHPWAWPVFTLGALFTFVLGYRIFRRAKPFFGNAL
jgi:homopolymeric O-antigen transport system permease protein